MLIKDAKFKAKMQDVQVESTWEWFQRIN
jgi:hypothetical protein